jgi:signal transduction histidine kinase
MKQRAKELGGEMRISNANPGTTVEVVIPSATMVAAPFELAGILNHLPQSS